MTLQEFILVDADFVCVHCEMIRLLALMMIDSDVQYLF